RADAAACGERNCESFCDAADGFKESWAIVAGGGDIEDDEFVRSFGVIAGGELDRVASIAQTFEVHSFDDACAVGVQAGNNAMREAHVAARRKFSRARAPAAPLFSGWNCAAKMLFVSRTEAKARPCLHAATISAPSAGAAKECAK